MKGNSEIKTYELWGIRIFVAWVLTSMFYLCGHFSELDKFFNESAYENINTIQFIAIMLVSVGLLTIINQGLKRWYSDIIIAFLLLPVYFSVVMYDRNDVYMCTIIILVLFVLVSYVFTRFDKKAEKLSEVKISNTFMLSVIGIALFAFLIYIGLLSVVRCLNMKSPSYDFGIFSQMFYYMKEGLGPLTTCERDGLLSHFKVHMSPIFYVLLPIYYVFPSPVTLLVMQVIIVGSAVIPLFLICRKKKLSNFLTICICITYLFYPAMRGGFFYDFHENKFLTPLILWFIYFMEEKKIMWSVIFGALTLMVKEDAPIYIACLALYYAITRKENKEKFEAIIYLGVSVIYFFIVVHYLSVVGDGAMTGRFGNFLSSNDDSIVYMIVNIVKNPPYFFTQLLDVEKLEFLLWTMLPLAFIPVLSRKLANYILILPYLLIHFISNYRYQHEIYYQYTYGTMALLFFMVILFFSENSDTVEKRKQNIKLAVIMAMAALIMSTSAISIKEYYLDEYKTNTESYKQVREAFESYIPKNASVEASSYYVVPLSSRKYIYHIGSEVLCDYIVYDLRISGDQKKIDEYQMEKERLGYEVILELDGLVRILRAPWTK
ncbi:MAG: DUF2079 domain-containing protein [Lachnospiraceae bacterium]|nr:DUF2079 domain-containing protein [Lachnospiraceae bacterium]